MYREQQHPRGEGAQRLGLLNLSRLRSWGWVYLIEGLPGMPRRLEFNPQHSVGVGKHAYNLRTW